VLTRGHSIENYFFSYEVLMAAYSLVAVQELETLDADLESFAKFFPDVLSSASALSIVAERHELLGKVRGGLSSQDVQFSSGVFELDVSSLLTRILPAHSEEQVGKLAAEVQELKETARARPTEVTRWLADGHLGFKLLWFAMECCVSSGSGAKNKSASVSHNSHNTLCASALARHKAKIDILTPLDAINLVLGQ
jgi:hypothetical protein